MCRKNKVLAAALGLLFLGVATSAARAEIPGLTDMEREYLATHGDSGPSALDGPVHYIAPGGTEVVMGPPSFLAPPVLVNGGFEDGNFNGWTLAGNLGQGGILCGNAVAADAFITNPGLIPSANNDPQLNAVYYDSHSARLGDELAWGFAPATEPKCSSIRQDAVIPANNVIFTFAYAVIAQNPGHGFGQDPNFNVKVVDLTTATTLYDVTDFTTSFNPGNPCNPWCGGPPGIVYRRWTEVTLPLVGLAGHTLSISLVSKDCGPSGHWCTTLLDGGAVVCPDNVPPSNADLAGTCFEDPAAPGTWCADLTWHAPADPTQEVDANFDCVPAVAAASAYEIAWSTSPIVTDGDFAAANQVSGEPTPAAPGTPETFQVCGLPSDVTYFALRSRDASNNTSGLSTATVDCSNRPPDCSSAFPNPYSLWPPNHQMVPITIEGVTDPDGDPVTITVTAIVQDEPLNTVGDGNFCPDASITDGSASVRAERTGTKRVPGNGRVYKLTYVADDGRDQCTGTVSVCVPHDQGNRSTCIDDNLGISSLGPCTSGNESFPIGQENPALQNDLSVRPFAGTAAGAQISYTLSRPGHVTLEIFSIAGRKVATLVDVEQSASSHSVTWNAAGSPSGIYYVRLTSPAFNAKESLVLVK